MLRSMTAYGKYKKNYGTLEIFVEMQSVNRKHLDVQIKMPNECLSFETLVRKSISEHCLRGQISVSVQILFHEASPVRVHLNRGYVRSLYEAAKTLADEVGCKQASDDALLTFMLNQRGVFQFTQEEIDEAAFSKQLHEVVEGACQELTRVKEREGAALEAEFLQRLQLLEGLRQEIAENATGAVQRYRVRLTKVLQEFATEMQGEEERIAKECALLADKLDVSEELSRFGYTLQHFKEAMKGSESSLGSGKVLEFVLQEMQREVNTLGSKSQDAPISKLVIAAKSEIEKLREQIQNVE